MSQHDDPQFTCVGCGAEFGVNPRVARALAGSKGDPDTPHLCWICAHLRHAVLREVAEIRIAFGEGEAA